MWGGRFCHESVLERREGVNIASFSQEDIDKFMMDKTPKFSAEDLDKMKEEKE